MRRSLQRNPQIVPQEQLDVLSSSLRSSGLNSSGFCSPLGFNSPGLSPAFSPAIVKRFSFDQNTIDVEEQKKMILRIRRENESIKEQLGQTELFAKRNNSSTIDEEEYEQAVKLQEAKIAELDRQIQGISESLNLTTYTVGELNQRSENPVLLQKKLNNIEAKLDRGYQKYNEAIAFNRGLRQEVDNLRCERVIFENLYKKLEREVDKENRASESTTDGDQENKSLDASSFMQQSQRPKTAKLTEENVTERLRKYEEDIALIQKTVPNTDFQSFTANVIRSEEKNVETFKQINDLSSEVTAIEKAIADLKKEKKKHIQETASYDKKIKNIKEMKDNLKRFERKNTHFESKCEEDNKVLETIYGLAGDLFNSLECHIVAAETMNSESINDDNVTKYFDTLEERAVQIITAYNDKKLVESTYKVPLQYTTNSSATKVKKEVGVPTFVDYSDDEGDGDQLFSMDDFMKKAMEKLEGTQTSDMLADFMSPVTKKKK